MTLLLVSTLIGTLLSLFWLVLAWARPAAQGLREWGLATFCFAAGTAMLGLRGQLPDFVSIDLGNAVVLVANGLCWSAARRFNGRRASLLLTLLPAMAWLLLRRLPGLTEMLEARIILMSVLTGLCMLAAAAEFGRELRRGGPFRGGLFRGIVTGSFLLHGLLVLVRIPITLLQESWTAGPALPRSGPINLLLLEAILQTLGTSFALLAMFSERAEREALAASEAARQAADQANEAKSRFLARMSHELRTPLNGVLGMAQILAEDPVLPATLRPNVAVIGEAGRHLLALVNDVLDLSQVEAGRLSFDPRPLRPARLAEGALDLVRPEAGRKAITLLWDMLPGCPDAVLGDGLRLRQVLLNLLGNAVKFTPPGGTVRLQVGPLLAGASPLPDPGFGEVGLRLVVTDTGPGIPVAQRALLFRDFSRMRETTGQPPVEEGHGLGLAISARLVQGMGGRIGMLAGPGGIGSQFWVEVPLPVVDLAMNKPAVVKQAAASPPFAPQAIASAAADPAAAAPRRVLVVDDIAVNRMVVQGLLQAAGHRACLVESGQQALDLLEHDDFDLVLMDVQMPGLDGLETTRRIRAAEARQPARRRAVILALTAETMREQIRACLAAGMDGHLAKPVEREGLLAAVRDA